MILRLLCALALVLPTAARAVGDSPDPPAWREPAEPFRIVGNIYYVGSKGLAAYLIVGRDGAILLDGTVEDNVPMIERNIRKLGVPLSSVKLLLNSHAHFDHAEGLAHLKRDTGAKMLAVAKERPALESGTPPSEMRYGVIRFAPVKVDRIVADGETVRLGPLALAAIVTPGHTPGCTSWATTVAEGRKRLRVIFPCSLTVAGSRLIGNRGYPGIVADFRRSFARLAAVRADIVLPFHTEQADFMARAERARRVGAAAYIEPPLLGRIVSDARRDFERELAQAEAAPGR